MHNINDITIQDIVMRKMYSTFNSAKYLRIDNQYSNEMLLLYFCHLLMYKYE